MTALLLIPRAQHIFNEDPIAGHLPKIRYNKLRKYEKERQKAPAGNTASMNSTERNRAKNFEFILYSLFFLHSLQL